MKGSSLVLSIFTFIFTFFLAISGWTADILILEDTVVGGAASLEANEAANLGFTVDVVNAATWGAMTTADFAAYKAIVLGDPNCVSGTSPLAAAEANRSVWSPAVTGNVIVVGTDLVSTSI